MDLDPSLEKILREYLVEERKSTWRADMRNRMHELFLEATKTRAHVDAGFAQVDFRFREIEKRLEDLEKEEEITKVQSKEELIGKLNKERAKTERWQGWFLILVGGLVLALITTGAALAFKALRSPGAALLPTWISDSSAPAQPQTLPKDG